jgi:uncharacterized membrane protein
MVGRSLADPKGGTMSDLPYTLVKYVHVLAAMVWVGGVFYSQVLAARAGRSDDPGELPRTARAIGALGLKLFLPTAIILFVAGFTLVLMRWQFSQLWVSLGMATWLILVLLGALYLGPNGAKVGKLFATEGPTSVAAREGLSKIFLVTRLQLVLLAFVVFLMVAKP